MKNLAKQVAASQEEEEVSTGLAYSWNKRILVVEDEQGVCESYRDILAPQGTKVAPLRSTRTLSSNPSEKDPGFEFDVTLCDSYAQALEAFSQAQNEGRPYAMGFFDVILGSEKDGYDLVKELNRLDSDLYAVFVTAYNDRSIESINKLLGEKMVGRWDYLNKPFTTGEILQKARNFITLWNLEQEGRAKTAQLAEVQNRLLESEKVASVAATARGVNHEFGNMLMQIMGKADISRTKGVEGMREGLERILEVSQKASKILDRFNNLSRTGEVATPQSWCFISHILEEALDLLEHQFKTSHTKVTVTKKDPVKAIVNGTSLLQVLVNLSINAIHAMGSSGRIDYSVVKHDPWVEIRLHDSGPGIKQELLDKVVEPFFTTKGREGTGLGLAICKEIVEVEHGGQLKIFNHSVKGLEVLIRLPIGGKESL